MEQAAGHADIQEKYYNGWTLFLIFGQSHNTPHRHTATPAHRHTATSPYRTFTTPLKQQNNTLDITN